ncbi:site-specific integrase [Burkholderia vietnamiensis]|uniref:hypothetical protein n=1 Tax=Burkholderia vietnamiensis TaxID=60552 RepID=UPI001CF1A220|nr:hypothetical protein [Burkholderia vietnamiensis]MCA8292092.1 hypothetical protein [Burkholderia vietnamiensis]
MDRSNRDGNASTENRALALPSWLRSVHAADLQERKESATRSAARSGKEWTLEADRQTRAVLNAAGKPNVSERTAHAYRRAYANMQAAQHTPVEHANSRQHYNFLRSAWRFCELEHIATLRRGSDQAMKKGDLASAKRRTERAFERAAVLDVMLLQPGHATWADKAEALRKEHKKPVKKSKRFGPPAPSANDLLLGLSAQNPRAMERHAERAAVVALFGLRPAELADSKGVRLTVEGEGKKRVLVAQITGAKVDDVRGQNVRLCAVPIPAKNGGAVAWLASLVDASPGGKKVVRTTTADVRSLNRAFASVMPGLSCYSFRHAVGSALKASDLPETDRAAFMGHRSTKSLESYGRRRSARGGRGFRARGSEVVREVPHTRDQKTALRAAKASARAAAAAVAAKPTAAPVARPTAAPRAPRPGRR